MFDRIWLRRPSDDGYSVKFMFYIGTEVTSAHYSDVIMDTIVSQITSLTIDYSTVYSDADQRKHQSSASLAFVRKIHRGPLNSSHKWPVTRKLFPSDDVIMTGNSSFSNVLDGLHSIINFRIYSLSVRGWWHRKLFPLDFQFFANKPTIINATIGIDVYCIYIYDILLRLISNPSSHFKWPLIHFDRIKQTLKRILILKFSKYLQVLWKWEEIETTMNG